MLTVEQAHEYGRRVRARERSLREPARDDVMRAIAPGGAHFVPTPSVARCRGGRAPGGGSMPVTLDLFSGGTFTRGSSGSYQTDADSIATASSNVRRVENRGDGDMLLTETSRTNSNPNTDFASWGGSSGATTLNVDTVDGPDGSAANVRRIDFGALVSAYAWRVTAGSTPADNTIATLSVWLRVASGTQQVRLGFRGKDGSSLLYGSPVTVTTTWQRFDVTQNVGVGVSAVRQIIAADGSGAAYAVYAWGVQTELNAYWPSSFIAATGGVAVTRSGDELSYAVGQYPAELLSRGFTMTVAPNFSSAEYASAGSPLRYLMFIDTNNYIRFDTATRIVARLASGTRANPTLTWNRGTQITVRVNPATGDVTVSGALTGNNTFNTSGAFVIPSGTLRVGSRGTGSEQLDGRIGRYIEAL